MSIKFGPAGNSQSFIANGHKSSLDAPVWLYEMGLSAYEYQCGRGVMISHETAEKLGELANKYNIALSIHAPYYTNLSNPEQVRREKTIGYILQSCAAARSMCAKRVVVHSGSLMKRTREEALEIACETLKLVIDACDEAGYGDITLCPELMGVKNQLGDLDEVLTLCTVDERLIPCIDFGHYNARNNGILCCETDFEYILDKMESRLGFDRVKNFHSHFSKIQYSEKSGEIRHLTFDDTEYGPNFEDLAMLLVKRGYEPVMICESAGTQDEDARRMKLSYERAMDIYSALRTKQ